MQSVHEGRVGIGRRLLPAALAAGMLAITPALSQAAPGGRVYERVSPPASTLHTAFDVVGARRPDTIAFRVAGPVGDPYSHDGFTTLQAGRTPTNWDSTVISPRLSVRSEPGVDKGVTLAALSDDGRTALVWTGRPLVERDRDGARDLYRMDVESGAAALISAVESGDDSHASARRDMVAASADLSRIVFAMADPLVPDAPVTGGVYEWVDGRVTLLSRLSDGTPVTPAWSSAIASQRSSFDNNTGSFIAPDHGAHVVSDDGRIVFWTQAGSYNATARLYARIDGSETVAYSTSQRTVAGGIPAGTIATGRFLGATHDGGTVFFSSTSELTDAATRGGGVYRYTFATETLEQITPPTQGGFNFLATSAMLSGDGSHLYFTSSQRLTPDAGTFNAYVWSEDTGTRLVVAFGGGTPRVDRVSRDGRFAVYMTTASVAGAQTGGNRVLYRYDAATSELRCASCRADGSPSQAASGFGAAASRTITEAGEVYFETADPLVDEDVNGVSDVYGFDGERPFLISSGRGSAGSTFGDVDADGRNVYFITSDKLDERDTDSYADVYTARKGGGFPAPQLDESVKCSGIDCAPTAPPAPNFQTPQSELVDGAGNVRERSARTIVKPSLTVVKVTAADKKRFARSGRVRIAVKTSTAATVTATTSVRIGGRWVRSHRVVRAFRSGGHATLQLSLSRTARRVLARQRTLRVRLRISSSRTSGSWTQSLVLRSAANRGGGR